MSRRITAVAGLAATSLLLAACGGSSDDGGSTGGGDSTGGGSASGEAVSYWLWDANQLPAYQMCADTFTETSGIEVEIEQYGWDDYWSGLTNNFVAGNAPDVFTDHVSQYPQFAAQGQLLDLTELIERDGVDLSIYQDGLADLWVDQEGARYGLPKDWDTIALFNPIFYLVSGLRWAFYGTADVGFGVSLGITLGFLVLCIVVIATIFRTGWRLRT